jgi:hypothetical protein
VPGFGSSRSGPTLARLVKGSCLASALHISRPRLRLLDRVIRSSTRGRTLSPPGIVPSQPLGVLTSLSRAWSRWTPDPRLGGEWIPPWSAHRRTRSRAGPSRDASARPKWPSSPSGVLDRLVPAGCYCVPDPHTRPGMATRVPPSVSADQRTWIFGPRHLDPPRRDLPSHPERSVAASGTTSVAPPGCERDAQSLPTGPLRWTQ